MKKWFILSGIVLGTASVYAQAQTQAQAQAQAKAKTQARVQPTNAPPTNAQPARASQSLLAQAPGPGTLELPSLQATRPNQIVVGKLSYSGITVQAIKAKNPLQLLNPAAPARYGSGQDNVVNFPFSGTGPMLKLFSLDF